MLSLWILSFKKNKFGLCPSLYNCIVTAFVEMEHSGGPSGPACLGVCQQDLGLSIELACLGADRFPSLKMNLHFNFYFCML